jgi:Transposase DDE domain group 1
VCWRVRGNDSCGRAENLIKLHRAQLASDRTRSPLANQMRLTLHTAEYWLILTVRDTIPKARFAQVLERNLLWQLRSAVTHA